MSKAAVPQTLEDVRALPELDTETAYIEDYSLPIYIFLDTDNRLMKLVKDIDGNYRKRIDG